MTDEAQPEGPDVVAFTFDQIDKALDEHGQDAAALVVELGTRGAMGAANVVHASEVLRRAMERLTESQTLILTVGGFDTDPRELWQIPDVCTFARRVLRHAGIAHWSHPGVRMLNEESLCWLLATGALGHDHPWRVNVLDHRPPLSLKRYSNRDHRP